jgi:hypothetical protein
MDDRVIGDGQYSSPHALHVRQNALKASSNALINQPALEPKSVFPLSSLFFPLSPVFYARVASDKRRRTLSVYKQIKSHADFKRKASRESRQGVNMQKKFFAAFLVSLLVAVGTLTAQDAEAAGDAPKSEPIGLTVGMELGFGNVLSKDLVTDKSNWRLLNGDANKSEYSSATLVLPYIDYSKTVGKWSFDGGFAMSLSTNPDGGWYNNYYDDDTGGTVSVGVHPGAEWAVSKATFKVAYALSDMITVSGKTDPAGDDGYGNGAAGYVFNPAAQLTFGGLGIGLEFPLGQLDLNQYGSGLSAQFVMSIIPTVTYKIGAITILARPYIQLGWTEEDYDEETGKLNTNDNGYVKYKTPKDGDPLYKVRIQGEYTADKFYARLIVDIPTGSEWTGIDQQTGLPALKGNSFAMKGLTIVPHAEFTVWKTLTATLDLNFSKIGADEAKAGKVEFIPTIGVNYAF